MIHKNQDVKHPRHSEVQVATKGDFSQGSTSEVNDVYDTTDCGGVGEGGGASEARRGQRLYKCLHSYDTLQW